MSEPLLSIEDLIVGFDTRDGLARAVDGVSLAIAPGQAFGLVGESGCGKSVTAQSLLRLLPMPPGRILGGQALFKGQDLLKMSEGELNQVRGAQIGMVFQEPMTSLNPVFRVGEQVAEVLRLHKRAGKSEARAEAVRLLAAVGIAAPEERAGDFPHQMSGGMRQRVMIAMAMACKPALLIADEPTTALDVSLQGQILALMRKMREEAGSSLLLITHDLDVVSAVAEETAVMYAGKIVEQGLTSDIFRSPSHPYTQGLTASRPRLAPGSRGNRLRAIPGTVPSPLERPAGCAFVPRCPYAFARCKQEMPPLFQVSAGRVARCWLRAKTGGGNNSY